MPISAWAMASSLPQRRERQMDSSIFSAQKIWAAELGLYSAYIEERSSSKISLFSSGRMACWAQRPWRSPLSLDFWRPSKLRGPVLFFAFSIFARRCFSVVIAFTYFEHTHGFALQSADNLDVVEFKRSIS